VLQQGRANPVEVCRFSPDGRYPPDRYEEEGIQATGRLRNSLVHPGDITHWSFRSEGGRVYLISGCADGSRRDGKITVYEFKAYLDDQVPILRERNRGEAQYPITFSQGQDFPLIVN